MSTNAPPPPALVPSARVARKLVPNEKLLWEGRRHPLSVWQWFAALLLVQLVTIYIAVRISALVALGLWLIAMAIIGFKLLSWWFDRLCVTNRRLMEVSDLVGIKVAIMPLAKMTDATELEPPFAKILAGLHLIRGAYGTLVVESAGQDQALSRIEYIPDVNTVYLLIMPMVNKAP